MRRIYLYRATGIMLALMLGAALAFAWARSQDMALVLLVEQSRIEAPAEDGGDAAGQ